MYDQVNLSSPGSTAPVDHWHNDSIAFAGVVVLSDMEVFVVLVVFNKKIASLSTMQFRADIALGWKHNVAILYFGSSCCSVFTELS